MGFIGFHGPVIAGFLPTPTRTPAPPPLDSPEFYCEEHKKRKLALDKQYEVELKELKEKQANDLFTQRFILHKEYLEDIKESKRQEVHALELSNDKIVRQNIKAKFSHARQELRTKYQQEKFDLSSNSEQEKEEEEHREQYFAKKSELKSEFKKKYNLEVFEKVLATLPRDSPSIHAIEEEHINPEESSILPSIAGKSATQGSSHLSTDHPAARAGSITSRQSSASRQSSQSKKSVDSRLSGATSKHSSLRLQDTPLLTKTPPPTARTTISVIGSQPTADPVVVKRNFWGKIVRR